MNTPESKQGRFGELFVQRVVDEAGNRLGWAVTALIDDGGRAEYLVLQHFQHTAEARSAQLDAVGYLAANRRTLSKLASASEFWEWNCSAQDGPNKYWTTIDDQDVQAFRNGQFMPKYPAGSWHPQSPIPPLFPNVN